MIEFFRFLRPTVYNLQRNVIEALPHGGICLFVRKFNAWPEDDRLFVSVCACDSTTLFNREVSKRFAREASPWIIEPKSFSTDDIITALMDNPDQPPTYFANLDFDDYQLAILDEARFEIRRIQNLNAAALAEQASHQDIINALNIKERYNDLQS